MVKRRSRGPGRALGLALAAAMAVSPFLGAGTVVAQGSDVAVDEIADNPTAYYGETVTVTGPVEDVLGPRSFTIGDAESVMRDTLPIVSDGPLMNSANQPISATMLDGQEVQVTGTVHQFNLAAFEDQLGVDLRDGAWADWAGQPAIVATSVMPTSARVRADAEDQPAQANAGQANAGQANPAPTTVVIVAATDPVTWTTVDRIVDDPGTYFGQGVALTGEIGEVLGPRSFTIEDDDLLFDEEMTVVSARPLVGAGGQPLDLGDLEGRRVLIRGSVHQFNVGAFEEQLGVNLDDDNVRDQAGQPALIASSIVLDPVSVGPVGAYPYSPPAAGAPGVDPYYRAQGAVVDAVTDNPSAYYGQRVTVVGEVGDALGPRSFTVEDSDLLFDEHIAVIGARPLVNRDGQPYSADDLDDLRVMVTGTVREFNRAEIERDLNLDLGDANLDGLEGQPVIVAESVRQLP